MDTIYASEDGEDETRNLWAYMTSECLSNCPSKLPASKRLIVLGDDEAHKHALVARLHGTAKTSFTSYRNGLEYSFLNVRDEYCENQTRLEIWIFDDGEAFGKLLKYALDGNNIADTTVLVVASMTTPWNIYNTINTWTKILQDHIEGLGIPESELLERKNKVLERFREYVEPGLSAYGSLSGSDDDAPKEIPVNLGVDILVVVTQTDHIRALETDFGYENEHFDFMQLALRQLCLSYGAALFYVSVKEDKNCDLLLKYILHRIYYFPFRIPAILLERDSIFVPSGWDTKNKIRILADSLNTIALSTPFRDVIYKPGRLSDRRNVAEVIAQTDQEFLETLQSALARVDAEPASSESRSDGAVSSTAVQRTPLNRRTRSISVQKKTVSKLVPGEGDTILHTFFKNLLDKRTSLPADRPAGLSNQRTYASKQNETNGDNGHLDSVGDSDNAQYLKQNGTNVEYDFHSNSKTKQGPQQSISENQKTFQDSGDFHLMPRLFDDLEGARDEILHSKFRNTLHLSLDQDQKVNQLPEYFLSNAASSFQDDLIGEFEDEMSPPLDRVRSSFNPPLHLLLEEKERVISAPPAPTILKNPPLLVENDAKSAANNLSNVAQKDEETIPLSNSGH